MSIPVSYLKPTDLEQVSLRRYSSAGKRCRGSDRPYHNAVALIIPQALGLAWGITGARTERRMTPGSGTVGKDDPRWPAECEACGEPFQRDDEWQIVVDRLYSGARDGALRTLRGAASARSRRP